jgi:hypothetical protein
VQELAVAPKLMHARDWAFMDIKINYQSKINTQINVYVLWYGATNLWFNNNAGPID